MAKQQGSGWKNDSRRHSLARKGISTATYPSINYDEKSGLWFESNGILDAFSLLKMVGFGELFSGGKASGITKEQYEQDAQKMVIFPSIETGKTVEWLRKEYTYGDRKRKKQIRKMVNIAIKELENKMGKTGDIDIRIELHKGRKILKSFEQEIVVQ